MSRLKGYRVMAGFTQEDIANLFGYSRVNYTYKENNQKLLSAEERKKLFKILKKKLPSLKYEEVFPVDG